LPAGYARDDHAAEERRAVGPLGHTRGLRRGRRRRQLRAFGALRVPHGRRQAALQRLQLFLEMVGVAEALAHVLFEQAQTDALRLRVRLGVLRARPRRRLRALHLEQGLAITRAERELAREHLEEQHAEGVQVRQRPRLFAPRLLRRHVLGRAEHRALRREPRIPRDASETEVEDLDEVFSAAALREQDVVALEIAVHDAEVVGTGQRGAHLLEDVDAARDGHRPAGQLRRERRAHEVLHHEIELALLRLADVVDVDDVRVIDAVGRPRFAQHPGTEVRLAAQIGADQLQRDHAIDEHVARAVDDAHAPFAEARFEPVSPCDHLAHQGVVAGATLGGLFDRPVHVLDRRLLRTVGPTGWRPGLG
jgi:hypothetical protein